jgi:hypothetical protein
MGFLRVDILPREAPGAQEFNETRPRGQTRWGGMDPWPGRTTQARLSLGPPMTPIFVS